MDNINIRGGRGEKSRGSEPIMPKVTAVSSNRPRTRTTANSEGVRAHDQIPLVDRELGFENGNKSVIDEIKRWAIIHTNMVNDVLQKNDLLQKKIKYNENESVELLIWKNAEGTKILIEKKLLRHLGALMAKNPIRFDDDKSETIINAYFCWQTLMLIFERYFEYEDNRNAFKDSELEKKSNIMVENIGTLLDQATAKLQIMKEEHYLATFRVILDPNVSCKEKNDFLGFRVCKDSTDSDAKLEILYIVQNVMNYIASDFIELQLLLDCLNKMRRVPKTYLNMKIGYNVLKNSLDSYKSCLSDIQENKKAMEENYPFRSAKYYTDYVKLFFYLQEIEQKYLALLNDAYTKNISNLFDEPAQTSNKGPKKKKRPKNKRKQDQNKINQTVEIKKSEAHGKDLTTPKGNTYELKESFEIKNLSEGANINQGQETENLVEVKKKAEIPAKQEEKKKDAIDLNDLKPFVYIEEEDEDVIIRETNTLMEVMREVCEQDRKNKIIRQEKKQKQKVLAKRALAVQEEKIITVEKKPEFTALNRKKTELLKTLLNDNPPDLAISGKKVKNLIEQGLGGTVRGAGGSMFHISWNGGQEKDGDYEVAHEGDRKGYLTSPYAKRVGESIRLGIESGKIVVDPTLLENKEDKVEK